MLQVEATVNGMQHLCPLLSCQALRGCREGPCARFGRAFRLSVVQVIPRLTRRCEESSVRGAYDFGCVHACSCLQAA